MLLNKTFYPFQLSTFHFPLLRLTDTGKVVKRLRTQNKKKLKRRFKGLQKGYNQGRLQWEDIKRSMAATHGHLIHGHTYRLRAKLYSKTVFVRSAANETEEQEI